MFFQHIYDKSLAQASYFIGCQAKGVAMVIDAQRDMDVYLQIAAQQNLKITHIAETHIHADFLSGSRELAAVTGAKMYLSDEGGKEWQYEFEHVGLKHGQVIPVGNLTFEVLHTPGHTPESISFLLTDHPASEEPVMIFTGDFVFVGDIGRPDLLEKAAGLKGTQELGAHQMYQSIKRFSELAPFVQVWPGHGAGSACGKALGAVPSSTVGYELVRNWAFQYPQDESGFVEYLLAGQPEPPKYFAMMKKLNKVDRALLIEVPQHPELSAAQFKQAYRDGIQIIDTRNKLEFARGFIPGSINIQHNNSLATWAGWLLNYQEQFIIISRPEEREEITRKLMRIGLDNIYGFVNGVEGFDIDLQTADLINIEEFKLLSAQKDVQIVDVRNRAEFDEGHVSGANHVFVGTLQQNIGQIDPNKRIVIHCQSGDRASIAYSLLRKKGFNQVKIYLGGIKEWIANGEKLV